MIKELTRRNFFKGSIVVAAGVASVAMLGSCTNSEPAPAEGMSEDMGDQMSGMASETGTKVTLKRFYGPAHRDTSFAQAVVALSEDGTILAASVDEYEFIDASLEGLMPVPNSDAEFGQGYVEGMTLFSKLDNNEWYSGRMKEKASATQPWADSMKAITDSVVGMKAEDLAGMDAVSGATLHDAAKYVALIADAAMSEDVVTEGMLFDESPVMFGRVNGAPHGAKAFANAVVLVQSGMVAAASIDGFQFLDAMTEGLMPVPNSDAGLGENIVDGVALVSKSVNSPVYSAMMKDKAGATTPWVESMHAIEAALVGKKGDEFAELTLDAVSGATLQDTANYALLAQSAFEAAQQQA